MRAHERFLEYVQINTASDPANEEGHPSSACQLDLARVLENQMRKIGLSDVFLDEANAYVYGTVPATAGCENAPGLGFIAHLDTAPDACGQGVKPLVFESYNGEDISLPSGHVIKTDIFKELKSLKGKTLITASGDTLLGADDKAGIAEILTMCEALLANDSTVKHGKICIAFTPDEEIGSGARDFDFARFGAEYAYTVDGGPVNEIEFETFNAAEARLLFKGVAVHPGTAKNIMVNAARLAMELDALIPAAERPETTEGREGFYHLCSFEGDVAEAETVYIIRDHSREKFEAKKEAMQKAAAEINAKYGNGSATLKLKDSYYNMAEVIEKHFHLVENAKKAIEAAGLKPQTNPIRGGTDGSRLSFAGLPCPNLGTGGHYAHGPNECIAAEDMDIMVDVLVNLAGLYSGV